MIEEHVIKTVMVDCDQCGKEEHLELSEPTMSPLPEDWIEILEGAPFHNKYQFCTSECFTAWHARDKNERLTKYHDRMRAKQEAKKVKGGVKL